MYIQIVNFHLQGLTTAEYAQICEQHFAPLFQTMPGLIAKVWLSSPETNTYGGVYTWDSHEALEAYKASAIFQGLQTNPNLTGVTSREFAVLEAPSAMTNGLARAAAAH